MSAISRYLPTVLGVAAFAAVAVLSAAFMDSPGSVWALVALGLGALVWGGALVIGRRGSSG